MSHFLERLARGVMRSEGTAAQPALRPMTGSIYAPAWMSDGREPDSPRAELYEIAAGEAREEIAERTSSAEPAREHRLDVMETPRIVAENAQMPRVAAMRAERLLPAEKRETRGDDFWFAARTDEDDATRDEGERPAATLMRRSEEPGALDLQSAVEFLTGAGQEETRAPAAARLNSGRQAARVLPAGASSQMREPDEITIHIGRIEVAAVQQQAPRPAAAPQRKAMSLDEYLKRGNGRAR